MLAYGDAQLFKRNVRINGGHEQTDPVLLRFYKRNYASQEFSCCISCRFGVQIFVQCSCLDFHEV